MTYSEKPGTPEELLHFGVLGMKWGVHRKQKRAAKQNVDASVLDLQTNRSPYVCREITEKEYKRLPSKPIKLGSDFLRIAANNKGELRDFAYVSKSEKDNNRYKALLAPEGKITNKKFELKIKTAKEAISPSEKERIDTFIKTLNQDVQGLDGKSMAKGREWIEGKNPVQALSDRELGLKYYNLFAQKQVMNTPLHQAYFNNLKLKGYNALVDDADRGIVTDLPVIIFPKESGARVTEIKPVSKDDLINAQINLTLTKFTRG